MIHFETFIIALSVFIINFNACGWYAAEVYKSSSLKVLVFDFLKKGIDFNVVIVYEHTEFE